MIKPETLYTCVCDKCGNQLIDDVCSAWYSPSDADEVAANNEWELNTQGQHFCNNCKENELK